MEAYLVVFIFIIKTKFNYTYIFFYFQWFEKLCTLFDTKFRRALEHHDLDFNLLHSILKRWMSMKCFNIQKSIFRKIIELATNFF